MVDYAASHSVDVVYVRRDEMTEVADAIERLEREYALYKHIAKRVEHAMHAKNIQEEVLKVFDEQVERAEAAERELAEARGSRDDE